MANEIKAKIYKMKIPAMKFAKKVNGQVVKKYIDVKMSKCNRPINDKLTQYVVFWGNYKMA